MKVALVVLFFTTAILPLTLTVAQSGSKCSVHGTPQVDPTLVRLENETTGSVYKRGKPIHVTLTLRAGLEGVYLPDFFGPFQEMCSHGFASEVLTQQGRTANPNEQGCGYIGATPKITYVALRPGETRTWSTDLATASIAPGHYCLYAEYISPEELLSLATNLPSDRSLVAKGRITAEPIAIEIR
ncbi:MAG TPA: hypothetical protein VKJ45_00280 [Blastocatellia bacterium]|nr:hypothetical protein [Blastocatellia bacterium]